MFLRGRTLSWATWASLAQLFQYLAHSGLVTDFGRYGLRKKFVLALITRLFHQWALRGGRSALTILAVVDCWNRGTSLSQRCQLAAVLSLYTPLQVRSWKISALLILFVAVIAVLMSATAFDVLIHPHQGLQTWVRSQWACELILQKECHLAGAFKPSLKFQSQDSSLLAALLTWPAHLPCWTMYQSS